MLLKLLVWKMMSGAAWWITTLPCCRGCTPFSLKVERIKVYNGWWATNHMGCFVLVGLLENCWSCPHPTSDIHSFFRIMPCISMSRSCRICRFSNLLLWSKHLCCWSSSVSIQWSFTQCQQWMSPILLLVCTSCIICWVVAQSSVNISTSELMMREIITEATDNGRA